MEKIPTIPLLQAKIKNLERCISDFKEYDAKRTKHIVALKEEADEWKKRCFDLSDSLDALYISIDEAKPSISNPKVKAVYFKMVEELKNAQKENRELKRQIEHYIKTGECDPIMIKINADLRAKNKQYKQMITGLQSVIHKLKTETES